MKSFVFAGLASMLAMAACSSDPARDDPDPDAVGGSGAKSTGTAGSGPTRGGGDQVDQKYLIVSEVGAEKIAGVDDIRDDVWVLLGAGIAERKGDLNAYEEPRSLMQGNNLLWYTNTTVVGPPWPLLKLPTWVTSDDYLNFYVSFDRADADDESMGAPASFVRAIRIRFNHAVDGSNAYYSDPSGGIARDMESKDWQILSIQLSELTLDDVSATNPANTSVYDGQTTKMTPTTADGQLTTINGFRLFGNTGGGTTKVSHVVITDTAPMTHETIENNAQQAAAIEWEITP